MIVLTGASSYAPIEFPSACNAVRLQGIDCFLEISLPLDLSYLIASSTCETVSIWINVSGGYDMCFGICIEISPKFDTMK